MGLRELKAERTRSSILNAALALFERSGYDDTTMEQIATAAEVGTSTLYRYFPTKDRILLDPVAEWTGTIADALERRPAGEAPGRSLRTVVLAYLREAEQRESLVLRLRSILDRTPVARAGLFDVSRRERQSLIETLAARTGRQTTDPAVVLSAHTAVNIIDIALDLWRESPAHPKPTATAKRYLGAVEAGDLLLAADPA
jgi:AcrR family transcriptional regulator